jgi:hypothetical protein
MNKKQEELLEAIRFLLAEYETVMEDDGDLEINPPQLIGCKICFIGTEEEKPVYKYNYDYEFEIDPESSYIDFM